MNLLKNPYPYVSNKTYLWRFLQGALCGAIFGFGIGDFGFGIGATVGVGSAFALRPKNTHHALIAILAVSIGIGAGLARFFDLLILGVVLGIVLGCALCYFYKRHAPDEDLSN